MRLGILGGGQLSRMMALAARPLGIHCHFFDPTAADCVRDLGPVTVASWTDTAALTSFATSVDVVTYESEAIPLAALQRVAQSQQLNPGVEPIRLMQDRLLEKQFFQQLGIPTAPFFAVETVDDVLRCAEHLRYPAFLKKRTNGYDGRGQVHITGPDDIADLDPADCSDCVLESFVPYDREISIIGCRDQSGQCAVYDVCENEHRSGILYKTKNRLNDPKLQAATAILKQCLDALGYVGICTIELFQVGETLLVNEAAPRVHNSGHWTIEAAVSSQFENHVRAVVGLPLGSTQSRAPVTMFNMLSALPDAASLLSLPGVHWHSYEKAPRANRKLGHVTVESPADQHTLQTVDAYCRGESACSSI